MTPPVAARRTRILFVIKHLQHGGTETQLLRIIRALDAERFDARLCLVWSATRGPRNLPFDAHYRLDANLLSARARRGLAAAIDDFQPDVVHSFRDGVNVLARLALLQTKHQPVLLVSVRGRPVDPMYWLLGDFLAERAYRFTVNSVGVAEDLTRFGWVPKEKIVVIPNLADTTTLAPATAEQRAQARNDLGLPQDAFVWVAPTRISYVKNPLGLVLGFALARRMGRLDHRVHLVIAGRARDRLLVLGLPRLVRWLGLDGQVHLMDPLDNPAPLYHAADAMVLPSIAEGMPNVTLEAHIAGLPVVATRQANRDGLVADGQTGFEIATGSVPALARAMGDLVALAPDERRAMGTRGRDRILELFSRTRGAEGFERLYLEAVAARRTTA